MAEKQLETEKLISASKKHKFESIEITVNPNYFIIVEPENVILKHKDAAGKSKMSYISKNNWIYLMGFIHIIQACFLMKNESKHNDKYDPKQNDKQYENVSKMLKKTFFFKFKKIFSSLVIKY